MNTSRLANYINREFESKPEKLAGLYFVLLLVCVVTIGYFGVIRGLVAYNAKRATLETVEGLNAQMLTKLEKINSLEKYATGDVGVTAISQAIPNDLDQATYLEELIDTSSSHGFILRDVFYESVDSNRINLKITLQGPLSGLDALIQALNDMNRLTRVNLLRVRQYADQGYIIEGYISTFYVPTSFKGGATQTL